MDQVLFTAFSALAVVAALLAVTRKNAVASACWLVAMFFGLAGVFVLQEAYFVATTQILVYAGAIMVLFLFVIMLLGVDREESMQDRIPYQRPAAIALGVILLAELLFLAGHDWATGQKTASGVPIEGGGFGGNVERVARVLFTDYMWAFEITAVLLVIAIVGAVVLARRSGQKDEPIDDVDDVAHEEVGA